ncbi:hypothetical protein AQUCO_07100024v1 [Aquilegia coerulea]|uniref:AB hydrolase-1 domain-containing protein n=1 Tax=Aquilegia coerulea TaxID=218851 RepID=A0A2G5CAR7_AQUCA|nr:hypothetical protein AQUCO_07100024v1 [Aquilegia coerulea]
MEQIQHKYIDTRGLKLHIADIGSGSNVVVFLHGFPEIWYSWRHQMIALANIGYRAIAPDLIGYGLSDQHLDLEKASFSDYVVDLLAILDSLNIPKAFLVGKDFGAWPVYLFALQRQERVSGIVTLGVPFIPPGSLNFHVLPEGFYISRWKEPGRPEADFGRFDVKTVLRNIYILFARSEIPIAGENGEIMDLVKPCTPLPPWLTEEDLSNYAALYENSGLYGPLQVPYRSLRKDSTLISNPKIQVPTLVILGGRDYFLKFPGVENYIMSGKAKEYVNDLEITFLAEGTHFVQEQFPDQVNMLITTFLKNHT